MALKTHQHRSGLPRIIEKLKEGTVTLGFIGGSITDAESGKRWPEYVIGWFARNYPGVRFYVENAAIGATGSDLAVFRAERDLINRGCDIVFIEYAVNDIGETSEKRMRTREGLIRKLLQEERDLVITYTYSQEMYEYMKEGKMPPSIEEFEALAEHYHISSIWMGLYALEEVKKGMMRWEEWLPDGLHPEERGSFSYAQSVIQFLTKELIEEPNVKPIPAGKGIPEPVNVLNWGKSHLIPFSEVSLEGPWSIRRWRNHNMIDQVLWTSAIGAKLSFSFKGRGLSMAFDFGKTSAEFRYRLDCGEWIETKRERPWWVGDQGWYKLENLYDDLENKMHEFELEVIHGNREECKGTNFRLIFIGVIE